MILSEFSTVTKNFTSIGSDLTPVRTQLLLRGSVAPVLPVLANVRSCFAAVLPDFTTVAPQLSPITANLSAISTQLLALCRRKAAAIRVLRKRNGRQSCQ
jgi:hypothetical protein